MVEVEVEVQGRKAEMDAMSWRSMQSRVRYLRGLVGALSLVDGGV